MPPKEKDQEKPEEKEVETEEESTEVEEQEEETQEDEGLSVEELRARLAKTQRDLKSANAEAKDRRLKLEALEKEKKDREEAELSEVEKLKKQVTDKETELANLRAEKQVLELEQKFGATVQSLKLSFVSDKARETAFALLDEEKIGEDFENLETEIKALVKDHSYLFGKPDPNQFITDGGKKSGATSKTVTKKSILKHRARIPGL